MIVADVSNPCGEPGAGTLISMLNQGFGTRPQGFEARALTGLGLGPPSAIYANRHRHDKAKT